MAEHLQPRRWQDPIMGRADGQVQQGAGGRGWLAGGDAPCFLPRRQVVVRRAWGKLQRWDVHSGVEALPVQAKDMNAIPFALNPDGKVLAASGAGNVVQLWDPETGDLYRQSLTVERGADLAFSSDGWTLAALEVGSRQGSPLTLCNLETAATSKPMIPAKTIIRSMAFSPDGKCLAVGGIGDTDRGLLQLWDASGTKELRRLESEHLGTVEFMAFSPGGTLLATADSSTAVRIWVVDDLLTPDPPADLLANLKKAGTITRKGKTYRVSLQQATDSVMTQLERLNGLTELELGDCDMLTETVFAQ